MHAPPPPPPCPVLRRRESAQRACEYNNQLQAILYHTSTLSYIKLYFKTLFQVNSSEKQFSRMLTFLNITLEVLWLKIICFHFTIQIPVQVIHVHMLHIVLRMTNWDIDVNIVIQVTMGPDVKKVRLYYKF